MSMPIERDDDRQSVNRRRFLGGSVSTAAIPFMGKSFQEARAEPLAPAIAESPVSTELTINGAPYWLALDVRTTLLDAMRERIGLTGSKKGCDHGQCGACTVLIEGHRINSCLTLAVMHDRQSITTIEGLAAGDNLHPVQTAFVEHDGFQCGQKLHASGAAQSAWPWQLPRSPFGRSVFLASRSAGHSEMLI
jgi:hypothetical protein